MKATEVSFNNFLHQPKTQFIIPVYQRNYDWAESQCAQMFNDIREAGRSPGSTHFIGSIVFIHEGVYTSSEVRQLVVINGQQRLTTFSLLYLALYKFALKHGREEKASEIKVCGLLRYNTLKPLKQDAGGCFGVGWQVRKRGYSFQRQPVVLIGNVPLRSKRPTS